MECFKRKCFSSERAGLAASLHLTETQVSFLAAWISFTRVGYIKYYM